VGREDEVGSVRHDREAQEFRTRLGMELEKVSLLYVKHERKMCRFFMSLEGKTDTLCELAAEQACGALCSEGSGSHPERITWQSARSAALVQQPANRQVFVALTAYLVHMDALRNFALLNTLALLKIANHHCGKQLRDDILGRLYQEPFYQCYRLTSLVDEIHTLQRTLLSKCFGHVVKSMSPQASNDDMPALEHGDAMEQEEQGAVRRAWTSPAGTAFDLEPESKGTTQTDARDLAAYCTWVNQKGRLPAWVCKGCEDPTQLSALAGDVRAVRVVPLAVGFARQLKAALEPLDLVDKMPILIQGPQHRQQQQQQQQQQQRKMPCDDDEMGDKGGAVPLPPGPRVPHHPSHRLQQTVHVSQPTCTWLRNSPGRRQHSPERAEPYKRQCLSPFASTARSPFQGPEGANRPPLIKAGDAAAAGGGGGGRARGAEGGSALRPQRCCYDLRLLDLQCQRAGDGDGSRRGGGGFDPLCVVQQAALDLSYLSLAMGSPCNSPMPTRPTRFKESMAMSPVSCSRGSSGMSVGNVPPVGAGCEEAHASSVTSSSSPWSQSSVASRSPSTCDAESAGDGAPVVDVQALLAAKEAAWSLSRGLREQHSSCSPVALGSPLLAAGPSAPWCAAAASRDLALEGVSSFSQESAMRE
jgi:hypothetical protein